MTSTVPASTVPITSSAPPSSGTPNDQQSFGNQQQQQQQYQKDSTTTPSDMDQEKKEGDEETETNNNFEKMRRLDMAKLQAKFEKKREMKTRLRELEEKEKQRADVYVKEQEGSCKRFFEHYCKGHDMSQLSQEERSLIEASFSRPELASWSKGLMRMLETNEHAENENKRLQVELEKIRGEHENVNRRLEKTKSQMKYLKYDNEPFISSKKQKTSTSSSTPTPAASTASTKTNNKAQIIDQLLKQGNGMNIEELYKKQRSQGTAIQTVDPKAGRNARESRGHINADYLKKYEQRSQQTNMVDVSASMGETESNKADNVLDHLPDFLKHSLVSMTNVSPYDDAYKYLKESAQMRPTGPVGW